ncbi:related to glyoxylate/hydroxypyruvate reductase [Sporisorium reilianum f. sp. reilianum]|uniref:Related to glyoxylate/hydroxypyruvate reductase n=1 Tax=Sporisorium reilianum f. sp. reilianum TaxID=72559 RepID=A0A2N8UJI7_9BASI|nr:related to glyoxylate/hydroxypyruvate reductase [Sporisorium reilianum f. sp. reilianum]
MTAVAAQAATSIPRAPPKIVSVFEHLPSHTLARFAHEQRIRLVTPPPGLSFAELNRWFLAQLDGAHAAFVWPAVRFGPEQISAVGGGPFRVVSTFSVGTDAVDTAACQRAGIRVGYTPYIGDDTVAEYTVSMLLHHCRRLDALQALVKAGKFGESMRDVLRDPTLHCGFSPAGKTVGLYGFGRIAQKVAEKLLAFGAARIAYTSSSSRPFTAASFPRLHALRETFYPHTEIANQPDLHHLAAEADILIVLCPETASTTASVNSAVFDSMKPTAVLINVARGSIVVNADLERALRGGQIAAALLDVVQGEPHIDATHPLLAEDLKDRVMILPHAVSTVVETRTAMGELTARNVLTQLGFGDELLGDKAELEKQHAWTHYAA